MNLVLHKIIGTLGSQVRIRTWSDNNGNSFVGLAQAGCQGTTLQLAENDLYEGHGFSSAANAMLGTRLYPPRYAFRDV